jgi:hypothetical protein
VIVLDTTILSYAVGVEHPLRDRCRQVFSAIARGSLAATTTVEVLQEFTHVRARRRPRGDAVARARSYRRLLTPLLQPTDDDLEAGWRIFLDHGVGSFDAVLAATAMGRPHVTGLMSADRGFSTIAGLRYLDPQEWDAP